VRITDKIGYLRIAISGFFLALSSLQALASTGHKPSEQADVTAVPTPTESETSWRRSGAQAILSEIAERQDETFLFSITSTHFDRIEISTDQKYAFAWLDYSRQQLNP
jgi:hypothetical protein